LLTANPTINPVKILFILSNTREERKGALVSERALRFDGDKPNFVRPIAQPG